MKLIIDIPEEVVTKIQNGEDYRYDIHTTIAQGIPYEPKGDLIRPIVNCKDCDGYEAGYNAGYADGIRGADWNGDDND